MNLNIELNHLKYFYFTVLEGGVEAAARKLHVQQPVVSKMLKNLEENLDDKLFVKQGRSKKLTDYGQVIYRHCQNIFEELNKIDGFTKGEQAVSGLLNVGGAEPIVNYVLPDLITKMKKLYPGVHFNALSTTQSHLLDFISESKIDLGLFFYINNLPKSLEVIKSYPVDFKIVVKKSKAKDLKVISSFIGSREIDDSATHKFPALEHMRIKYPNVEIKFSSNSLTLHKNLVLKGEGVSIIPNFMVKEELKKGSLIDLYPKKKFIWDMMVVKRKSDQLSLVMAKFLETLDELKN